MRLRLRSLMRLRLRRLRVERRYAAILAFGLSLLSLAGSARAELGGNAASIEADRAHMLASVRQTPSQNYTVHEITTPSGTVVREYLAPSGQVFAVAWNGPMMPDLKQLFGANFARFQAAAQSRGMRRGPFMLSAPDLVIHSGGHMRSFYGRAYLPQLVPANVSVDEIR